MVDPKDEVNIKNRNEVWKALEEEVQEENLYGAGVSNFQVRHLESLMSESNMKPIMNQIEVHPLYLDDDTVNLCKEQHIVIEAYAPFAQGNEKLLKNLKLAEIAKRNDIDVHQLILLWCVQKDFVILPRSSNAERQERNISLDGLQLSEDDMGEIDELRNKEEAFKQCWNPKDII